MYIYIGSDSQILPILRGGYRDSINPQRGAPRFCQSSEGHQILPILRGGAPRFCQSSQGASDSANPQRGHPDSANPQREDTQFSPAKIDKSPAPCPMYYFLSDPYLIAIEIKTYYLY